MEGWIVYFRYFFKLHIHREFTYLHKLFAIFVISPFIYFCLCFSHCFSQPLYLLLLFLSLSVSLTQIQSLIYTLRPIDLLDIL